jgi:acetoacetyl-CoA synthetase
MHRPLWTPTAARVARANLTRFMEQVRRDWHREVPDQAALYRWSVERPEEFWQSVWSFTGVVAQTQGDTVLARGHLMPGARWFPGARLNFAENLLQRRDDSVAILFRGEGELRRSLTFAELHDQVSRLVSALRAAGVTTGDRVAGYLPNIPEAVVAMLATTSIGAIWSSCSPDFGVQGVVDRFGQIEPKVLFCADGYHYNGRRHDSLARLPEILRGIPSIERTVVVANTREAPRQLDLDASVSLEELCAGFSPSPIRFEQLAFDHPVYVMYSSGTTGPPKCIVHGAGGTLIQHLKEHQLHDDVKPGDRLFYFTTCGWMMWNWLVSGLASGASLLLYDGSPFHPGGEALFDFAEETAMTVFGTSAKYIDAVKKEGLAPRETHDLSSLRTVLSTGSPLSPESFEFVYEKIKPDVCLSSISGGTDIISCFVLGNPLLPVWSGEIQCRGLGMAVEVFDGSGRAVRGEQGELVCTAPFPSMPVGFWRDPEGRRYRRAYFEKFPGVWCHGDYAELTERDGVVIHGRSDAVLNPGGVRIGTAEIYRQVEQLDEVLDSLVIGQEWQGDVRVVLFVRLREGQDLDETLRTAIRGRIRRHTTPRHVPAKIVQVTDIPRTRSGKIVELAVRDLVHGRPVKNEQALANPEALVQFQGLPELQS